MRSVTVAVSVLLVLVAFAGQSDAQKATTVDELAALYDVSSCKQCHAKIYAEWEQ
jgi:hypothetical protein